ncbi:hypothetical protein [Variovorax sp. PAMC26660]|uniref:hypothetical protein n=1 Tax=Variovorax sp. PAMC26660 TaxID=2762322 RepID=UPI00164E6214|nr:hypothetical protein [Variovorax sp. PAMC26660]QNK65251.1 hypothetical protein H7F35_18680 [Variovorax sp. PAMC26660]
MPIAAMPPAPSAVTEPAAQPAPTASVAVMPNPTDPSEITRYSSAVPFGEKGDFVSSEQVVYRLGTTAVSDPLNKDVIYTVPLRGTVRYPVGEAAASRGLSKVQVSPSGGFPVVVFLHGMHDDTELNNAKGYDYLQKSLAEQGYVALSIDAGKINGLNNSNASDAGALARGQLLMTTLDLLRTGNATGVFNGVELAGLKGKLDLDRVGILGHSRGAEAVAYAVELNKQRIGISYEDVETVRWLRFAAALTAAVETRVDAATTADRAASAELTKAKSALAALPAGSPSISAFTQAVAQRLAESLQAKEKLGAETLELEKAKVKLRQAQAIRPKSINADSSKWLEQTTSPDALAASGIVLPSSTEAPHKLRAVFSLAPINARQLSRVTHVPFATLLPTCDGDVYNMPGAQIFDDSRYTAQDESAPKYQIVVRGANHNFYNDHWSETDDALGSVIDYDYQGFKLFSPGTAPLHCKQTGRMDSLRMSADDQRRNGAFLIESFMRYFVGDEVQFAPYWKGQAPTPAAGCPAGETTCDERVVLTIHQPAAQRKLLQGFRNADSIAKNPSGLSTVLANFNRLVQCQFLGIRGSQITPTRPVACTDPVTNISVASLFGEGEKYSPRSYDPKTLLIWSVTDQAQLQWDAPGPTMTVNTGDLSAKGFDTLSFRVAVAAPIGQEVEVSVVDTQGRKVALKGSDFSDALYGIARKPNGTIPLVDAPEDAIYADTGTTRPLLNMVAVPLRAFALHEVDLEHIAQVQLRFPKASGSVAVTDVQLQRMD